MAARKQLRHNKQNNRVCDDHSLIPGHQHHRRPVQCQEMERLGQHTFTPTNTRRNKGDSELDELSGSSPVPRRPVARRMARRRVLTESDSSDDDEIQIISVSGVPSKSQTDKAPLPLSRVTPSGHTSMVHSRPSSSQASQGSSSQSTYPLGPADPSRYSFNSSFGSSILKSTPKSSSSRLTGSSSQNHGRSYGSYIRPSTGAFQSYSQSKLSAFDAPGYTNGWPNWVTQPARQNPVPPTRLSSPEPAMTRDKDEVEENGENFDIGAVQLTAADYQRSDDPEAAMRELLAGAVGDGEDDPSADGDAVIEGFADGITLMPHQVRGVKWMAEREKGRKYGGILADDMGLGKTVQTLARIVQGKPTPSEKKLYKGGTLIIAPLAVMDQWANECKSKTKPGTLKVTTHHGPKRAKTGKALEQYDVVITTYQILSSEFSAAHEPKTKPAASESESEDSGKKTSKRKPKPKAPKRPSALFQLKWHRVVVDEAQNIKNHKTAMARAAVDINAKYRWCLTGTPIQNKVEELYSLFRFLRARPLDDWSVFRARVLSEVQEGRTGVAMKRLHIILRAIMLRRTKDATINGKPILSLPGREVEVVECSIDAGEHAFYEALKTKTERFAKSESAKNSYTSVLTMLLRLRQACNHPSLVVKSANGDKDALGNKDDSEDSDEADELADMLSGLGVGSERKCELCFESMAKQGAKYCDDCLDLTNGVTASGGVPSSAKIRTLIKILHDIDQQSQQTEKTIVFSQFTSFLSLLEPCLKNEGIEYVRYDGSLRADEREAVLNKIRTSTKCRVILISFKAGSTGLNLTCCNHVVLMDMWWNPALEDQAFDRAHRLGQKRDVKIKKLMVPLTVENRILEMQDSKRELAKAALSGEGVKNMKLTMADIMKLMKGF